MRSLDISGNTRIPILMELVGALSRAEDPQEVLRIFTRAMVRLNGPRGYVSLSTRGLRPGEYRITRMLSDEGEATIDSVDPWSSREAIPVHTGGFFGEIIRQAYPEVIHDLAIRDDPVVGNRLSDYRSLMAVPIFDNGEPLNWAIFLLNDPAPFTVQGLEETILRTNLVGGTVRKVLALRELREANRRIEREVEQISRIQRTLLPEKMPDVRGLTIAASYETFSQAGGDYYDFLPMRLREDGTPDPDGPWGILIADASGHGPAAAVVMAMLHAILHAYPSMPKGPAEVLEHTNRQLCAKRIESSCVTAFFAIYDPKSRELRYASAGHNPPLVKSPGSGGAVVRLDEVGSVPLGVMEETIYEEATVTLGKGQSLVLYTDGIVEASCPGGDMFGVAGLELALTACTGEPQCVIGSIADALRCHEADVKPSDDQTLVILRLDEEGTEGK